MSNCALIGPQIYTRIRRKIPHNSTAEIKPFKPVTKATIARWVKTILQQAGIDVSTYTAHSSRAAATSHAQKQGLNLHEIMKSAGWTSLSTFEKFYKKPTETIHNLGEVVLNSVVS